MDEVSNATLLGPTTGAVLTATLEPSTMPGSGALEATSGTAAVASAGQPARAGARPGVVQLAIREKAALYAAYMPFVEGGGLFVPHEIMLNPAVRQTVVQGECICPRVSEDDVHSFFPENLYNYICSYGFHFFPLYPEILSTTESRSFF